MQLVVHTPRTKKTETIVKKTFKQIDQIFNNWNPKSEISKLNQTPAYQRVEISNELAAFLHKVTEIVEITEGRFDPTVAPLVHMWKTHLKKREIPQKEKIDALKPAIGWDKVHLEGTTFYKDHPDTEIDLCSIAKGYTVDLLAERLGEHSYVEWGGEIATNGSHPEGRKWRVQIVGGDVVEIEDNCIATSGTYLQKWEAEGKEYTHLVDPKTCTPLVYGEGVTSATVIGSSCMEADAIATSLMFFSTQEEARRWAEKFEVKAFIR